MIRIIIGSLFMALFTQTSLADQFDYNNISRRHADVEYNINTVKRAKMEGECLLGLKNLNLRKVDASGSAAEWTRNHSLSLLQQFSPCTVLIIMEEAHSKMQNNNVLK